MVNPTRNPCARHSRTRSSATLQSNAIFSSDASAADGSTRERNSAGVTTAVPLLPTTTDAAALATRTAGSKSIPHASKTASVATTVSPAPDTSRTFTG